LACIDVVFSLILFILTLQLREDFVQEKLQTFRAVLIKNYETAKNALNNVFRNKNLRLFLIYRSLANHVSFFFIISLPVLVDGGMQEWLG
jgi:MFS-type transporter involved in bile tolerance (Atg22 family)